MTKRTAKRPARSQSSQTSILLAVDRKNSVLAELKNHDVNNVRYSAYGQRSAELDLGTSLGFNGEFREADINGYLLGNGHRAYNPVLMRFHSPDQLSPFGEGGLNAYTYCIGDPVNRSDPSGRSPLNALLRLASAATGITGRLRTPWAIASASSAVGAVISGGVALAAPQGSESELLGYISLGLGVLSLGTGVKALGRLKGGGHYKKLDGSRSSSLSSRSSSGSSEGFTRTVSRSDSYPAPVGETLLGRMPTRPASPVRSQDHFFPQVVDTPTSTPTSSPPTSRSPSISSNSSSSSNSSTGSAYGVEAINRAGGQGATIVDMNGISHYIRRN